MPYATAWTRLRRAAALLSAAGLVACSTPAPGPTPKPGPDAVPAPPPVAAPPAAAPAPSAAVAARFPDPPVQYRTPAFQGRNPAYTGGPELRAQLRNLARDQASVARLVTLGTSQQGAALEALLFTRSAQATPEVVRANGKATVLVFAQQRGDEPAGAEALLVLAQELAQGRLQRLPDRLNVIVWPRMNPDAAAGAAVLIDRDHLQLKTPEAQALARLVREYQPVVVVEAGEYLPSAGFVQRLGAVERQDAQAQYAGTGNLAPFITKAAEEWFREPLWAAMKRQDLSIDWHYAPSPDPAQRTLAMGDARPDGSRNALALKNTVSLLIESRGVPAGGREQLKRRVYTLVTGLSSVLQSAADRGADLLKLRQYVDADISSQACKGQLVVQAGLTPSEYTLQALDPLTGQDKTLTVNWESSLALRDLMVRPRPCGYWLAADQTEVVNRLRLHGVRVDQIQAKGVVQGDSYVPAGQSSAELKTVAALLDAPVGSYYVPLSQPLANLAAAALEPDGPGSFYTVGLLTDLNKVARVSALPGFKMAVMP